MKTILFALFAANAVAANPYIVLFKQSEVSVTGLEHSAFIDLLQTTNQKSVEQLKTWLGTRQAAVVPTVSDLWMVRGATVSLEEELAAKLSKEGWVTGVYPSQIRKWINPTSHLKVANTLAELGNDTWGLERIGLAKIRKEWPKLDGSGIRVGILDTGIQSKHPELTNKNVLFKDFVVGLNSPYDDHGHGTHVAGTISGLNVGIAPNAQIIFAKGFTAAGSASDVSLLASMQWLFDPDGNPQTADYPQVISNSWGGDLGDDGVTNLALFAPFQRAIEAWIHGGIIPVFAAGNSGAAPNGFPGGFPDVIAVGAMDSKGLVADFSSRGPNLWKVGESVLTVLKPDVAAPGVEITSAFPGNKYATWDGTSMATPHVTGAVALLLQANPKLKFAKVKEFLLKSSEKKIDTNFGYGILNAYELVKLGMNR